MGISKFLPTFMLKINIPMKKNSFTHSLKQGFLFYAFSTLALALLMVSFISGSTVLELMDMEG